MGRAKPTFIVFAAYIVAHAALISAQPQAADACAGAKLPPVINLVAQALNETQALVTFRPPANTACIQKYVVSFKSLNASQVVSKTITAVRPVHYALFGDLVTGHMYEVRVTSNGDAGATSGVTTTLLAMPPACTPFTSAATVEALRYNQISYNSISVQWARPATNPCVVNYIVTTVDMSEGGLGSEVDRALVASNPVSYSYMYMATNLQPLRPYKVTVQPSAGRAGGGLGTLASVQVTTQAPPVEVIEAVAAVRASGCDGPPNPVKKLKAQTPDFTSVWLSWDAPNGGCVDYYHIDIHIAADGVKDRSGQHDRQTYQTSTTISHLVPGVDYRYTVHAVNEFGSSDGRSVSQRQPGDKPTTVGEASFWPFPAGSSG